MFLITGLRVGGAEAQLVRVAAGLRARGHKVRVLTMIEPEAHTQQLRDADVPWHSLGMTAGRADPAAIARAISVLKNFRM